MRIFITLLIIGGLVALCLWGLSFIFNLVILAIGGIISLFIGIVNLFKVIINRIKGVPQQLQK
jgi:hypothetical protein